MSHILTKPEHIRSAVHERRHPFEENDDKSQPLTRRVTSRVTLGTVRGSGNPGEEKNWKGVHTKLRRAEPVRGGCRETGFKIIVREMGGKGEGIKKDKSVVAK